MDYADGPRAKAVALRKMRDILLFVGRKKKWTKKGSTGL